MDKLTFTEILFTVWYSKTLSNKIYIQKKLFFFQLYKLCVNFNSVRTRGFIYLFVCFGFSKLGFSVVLASNSETRRHLPPKCWDSKYVPPSSPPFFFFLFLKLHFSPLDFWSIKNVNSPNQTSFETSYGCSGNRWKRLFGLR